MVRISVDFISEKTRNRVWNSWVLMRGENCIFTIRSLYGITWYSLAETNCVVKIVKTAINAQQLSTVSSPWLSLIYLLCHDRFAFTKRPATLPINWPTKHCPLRRSFFIKICVLSTSNIHVTTVFNPVNVLVKCTNRVKFLSVKYEHTVVAAQYTLKTECKHVLKNIIIGIITVFTRTDIRSQSTTLVADKTRGQTNNNNWNLIVLWTDFCYLVF